MTPIFFDTPWKLQKTFGFLFSGVSKETSGMKWVKKSLWWPINLEMKFDHPVKSYCTNKVLWQTNNSSFSLIIHKNEQQNDSKFI